MYIKETEEIKEYLCDNIKDVRDDMKQKGVTDSNLNRAKDIFEAVKDILKIDMLMSDEYGEYSRDGGDWEARGSYRDGNSYRGGSSYAGRRRDSKGRYSRDGGKDEIIEHMREAMDMAESDEERQVIRRCISQLENA